MKPWKLMKIQPQLPHTMDFVLPTMELEEGEDIWDWEYSGNDMANLVQAGNNFVVLAALDNDEGVPFYILQCQAPK